MTTILVGTEDKDNTEIEDTGKDYRLGRYDVRCQWNKHFDKCRFIKNADHRRTCCKPCKMVWDPQRIKEKDMCIWGIEQCCKQRCCRYHIIRDEKTKMLTDFWDWDSGWGWNGK